MRTFLAIPVPEEIKQFAAEKKASLSLMKPDVKWVEYENYHLTLKFLGDIMPDLINQINYNMNLVGQSSPPFELAMKGIGFFPNKRRPRVIWLGMDGELEKAEFLGERVDAYLSTLRFEAENKRSFHLTLGRVRSEHKQDELLRKAAELNKTVEEKRFIVSKFHLMESRLSPAGPQYSVLSTFNLEG
ncbi:MAG: RNA 2',3'-cyclic phosphodiesterase [Syntrophomonas sp.]